MSERPRSDVVLLHGWGSTPSVFDDLSRALGAHDRVHALPLPFSNRLDAAALHVAARAPRECAVVGWSLGAQIALEWARVHPQQVTRLVLIAATPCFVQRDDWLHGVDREVFAEFSRELALDARRTLTRFIGLQARGDARAKRLVRALRSTEASATDVEGLTAGLRILRETDLRDATPAIRQPVLLIQGQNDTLVPRAAADFLCGALPNARREIIEGAAHAPFISDRAAVANLIAGFLDE